MLLLSSVQLHGLANILRRSLLLYGWLAGAMGGFHWSTGKEDEKINGMSMWYVRGMIDTVFIH
jgi:hypothetical protein